ncbi:MAG: HAD hydrolase family protein [bacterium]|nr:HAD hydrolase family protein [bacterium]
MASIKLSVKNFILDVDGVFTDGAFHYTAEGKAMKKFGPDDHDALILLKPYLNICVVTGDKKGFAISQKRIEEDMKFPLHLVSTLDRTQWIKENFDLAETVYMGDGIFDAIVFDEVAYGIAPANAFYKTKEKADFVTQSRGGDSAVAEAVMHIFETFFEPIDLSRAILDSGEWKK